MLLTKKLTSFALISNRESNFDVKSFLFLLLKLSVSSDAKIRSSNSDNGAISDACKLFNDLPVSGHFKKPSVIVCLCPVVWLITKS